MAYERSHVGRARRRLDDLIARTASDLQKTLGLSGRHQGDLYDRDVAANQTALRLRSLRAGSGPLCFGRIDLETGESLVIGRTGVSDVDFETLVVDWRARAAAPFYRATGPEPLGVVRRRHFLWRNDDVVALDDEVFDHGAVDSSGLELCGEAALLHALTDARRDRMGDIVATIQQEQHRVIHAPLAGTLIVQGGPGTGKTAVALHRAAYLLYAYRFPLEAAGVLFIGPNRRFLRYVGDVLPSLGETTVRMATITELVDGVVPTAADSSAVVAVKRDERMAAVLEAAVVDRERPLRRALRMPYGPLEIVLPASATVRLVDATRRAPGSHNERVAVLRRLLIEALRRRFVRAEQRLIAGGLRGGKDLVSDEEQLDFVAAASRSIEVRRAIQRMWPALRGEDLVADLLRSPALFRSAATGVLSDADADVVVQAAAPAGAGCAPAWSPSDIALIDEASYLLGPLPGERAATIAAAPATALTTGEEFDIEQVLEDMPGLSPVVRAEIERRLADQAINARGEHVATATTHGRRRAYGHVLVDEAQDLSPMEWRMVRRRGATGSFTVVGSIRGRWQSLYPNHSVRPSPHRSLTGRPSSNRWGSRDSNLTA